MLEINVNIHRLETASHNHQTTAAVPADGIGYPNLSSIHASPSKLKNNTINVQPGPSPTPTLTPSVAPTKTLVPTAILTMLPTWTSAPSNTPGGRTSTITAVGATVFPAIPFFEP